MPPLKESDESILRKIETRLGIIEQIISAQSEAMRNIVKDVEQMRDDWRTQKAARIAWTQIMDTVKWTVLFVGTVLGTIAAYIGMHK